MWYIIFIIIGFIAGFLLMGHFCEPVLIKEDFRASKYTFNFNYSCKWIRLLQEGKSLAQYFKDNQIDEVAIYGMGALGKRLYEDLQKANVTVAYVIDRDSRLQSEKYMLLSPEAEFPPMDTIVVTAAFEFEEIKTKLKDKTCAKIISLKDIIDEVA